MPILPLRREPDRATIALGTMNFGKRTPSAEAERIVHRALDHGIRVLDTANAYVDGESERIVGKALRSAPGSLREQAVIATKVGFKRVGGKPEGLGAARVAEALDESLRNLGVDAVDLYYLHVPDHATPIEETLGAIAAILERGKAKAFGVSNYASWQIVEIFHACDRIGMPRPVVAQQIYNLLIRQLDVEYMRFAARYGLHTTVYNPLAGGLLTGSHREAGAIRPKSRFDGNKLYQGRYWSEPMRHAADAYEDLAKAHGLSAIDLAYAWLARAPGVDSILVGPGSEAHLADAVRALGAEVSPALRREVEALHLSLVGTETTYAR
jgi:aryl-alcohol dehydrogenase-like predicted oxidoreductase